MIKIFSINNIINKLKNFWYKQGCITIYPINTDIGAATSHYVTSLHILINKPIFISYLQLCKRPNDSRLTINSNKLQQYLQFQVIIKPIPENIQQLYLKSLVILGINLLKNDIKFIDDNWENPTLGAWGVGWEIWINGLEISQFTYFQKICGIKCIPTIEITYGIERLSLCIQKKKNIFKLLIDKNKDYYIFYKNLFLLNEIEFCKYNLKYRNIKRLFILFNEFLQETIDLLKLPKILILPAYDNILKAIHYFNLLDANKIFSLDERQRQILKISKLVKLIANNYINNKIK